MPETVNVYHKIRILSFVCYMFERKFNVEKVFKNPQMKILVEE